MFNGVDVDEICWIVVDFVVGGVDAIGHCDDEMLDDVGMADDEGLF